MVRGRTAGQLHPGTAAGGLWVTTCQESEACRSEVADWEK